MKLLAENGRLRPKVQFVLFAILGVFFVADAATSLLSPSSQFDRVSTVFELIALPGMAYFSWQGYRKMRRNGQTPEGSDQTDSGRDGVGPVQRPDCEIAGSQGKSTLRDYFVIVLANATIPLVVIWQVYSGDTTKGVAFISSVLSAVGLNAVLLWGIVARNRRRTQPTPARVIVWCAILAVASIGTATVGLEWTADMTDPLRVAYSSTPLEAIHPEKKRLLVEFLRRKERIEQDYRRVAASAKPIVPTLYSAESFANTSVMQSTRASVQGAADKDFSFCEVQKKADGDFQRRMVLVDPASDYLNAVESRSKALEDWAILEHEWVSSVDALYAFADAHSKAISARQGKVVISSDSVRVEFSKLLQSSDAIHKRLIESIKSSAEEYRKARIASGLSN